MAKQTIHDSMADTRDYQNFHKDINFHNFEKEPIFFGRFLKKEKLEHDCFLFSEALTGDACYIPAHSAIIEAMDKIKAARIDFGKGVFRIERTGRTENPKSNRTYFSYNVGFSKD